MRIDSKTHRVATVFRRPLEYIAIWQLMCFMGLVCLVWVNALYDLSNILFDTPTEQVNWQGPLALTVATLFIAVLTIGNTFLQQKRILSELLVICSYCRRVKVQEIGWQMLDHYLVDKTLASISHGICPACAERVLTEYGLPLSNAIHDHRQQTMATDIGAEQENSPGRRERATRRSPNHERKAQP